MVSKLLFKKLYIQDHADKSQLYCTLIHPV